MCLHPWGLSYFCRVYHMWRVTGIQDKFFAVMLLVWSFFRWIVCHRLHFMWRCLRILFPPFIFVAILFFIIFHFAITSFIFVIFVLVVLWIFSPDYLLTVFIDMSKFVAVTICWYVCTFFMTAVFSLVPVSTSSCTGTLVLRFYVKGFSFSIDVIVLDCFLFSKF